MSCVQKKLTMQVHVYTYTYSLNYFIISIVVPHGFQYIILENDYCVSVPNSSFPLLDNSTQELGLISWRRWDIDLQS